MDQQVRDEQYGPEDAAAESRPAAGEAASGPATGGAPIIAPAGSSPPELIAYRVTDRPAYKLTRAPFSRQWMDESQQRFANRCLPLLIANQSGWWVLNSDPFRAYWTGGWDKACIHIERLEGAKESPSLSHFGEGVLTFHMPWLFRTPPGYNLLARGPANLFKDGIVPLEGVIETDWAVATFTMNWRFTTKNLWVTFEKDEPICMLVPQRRGELEAVEPKQKLIEEEPELKAAFQEWSDGRAKFITGLNTPGSEERAEKWQRHYFRGVTRDGSIAPQHQTRLALKEFQPLKELPTAAPTSPPVAPPAAE